MPAKDQSSAPFIHYGRNHGSVHEAGCHAVYPSLCCARLLAARRRMTPAAANAPPAASSSQVAGSHRGESLPGPLPVDGAATGGPPPPYGVAVGGGGGTVGGWDVGATDVAVGTVVAAAVDAAVAVAAGAAQPEKPTSFVSIVTAPLRAKALPDMLAPFCRAMLVSARIFPTN